MAFKGALLCAGLGTRLRPLTEERPKPLLPVCDVPAARYGLALLRESGVDEVGVNLHYLAEQFRAELGDEVIYADEPEILGTGGALKNIAAAVGLRAGDDLVVHNGKVILDVDLAAILAEHRASGAIATMVVRPSPNAAKLGAIDVGEDGRVREILGPRGHMFCGIHVLRAELVERLPIGVSDSIRQGYIPLLREGALVRAHVCTGTFAEHSTPSLYLASNRQLLAGARVAQARWPLTGVHPEARVDPDVTIRPPVLVAAGAHLRSGATVGPEVVIGRGAVVEAGAVVERTVVWPGARVAGVMRDAVVTTRATIAVESAARPEY